EEMRRIAEHYLARGEHVLLDATFLSEQERQGAAALANGGDAEFWMIECTCPDAVIRRRLQRRSQTPNASDADLAVYESQRRAFQPIALLPSIESGRSQHVQVNTDQPPHKAAGVVVNRFLSATEPPD